MGQNLADIYTTIQNEGGMRARMRLAMMTGLPSQKAMETPDTAALLDKFVSSYREIMLKDYPIRLNAQGESIMAEYVREEILIEHSFDRRRCRHEIGGLTAVLHCHHFATLISRLANDCKLIDAKHILADCAEDAFYTVLSNYFKRHDISGIARRASLAEQYFSAVGLGLMRVKYAGYCSGEVIMEHSHVDEGWLKKWGEANCPVNHIGRGYVTAAFSALFDRSRRVYFATERQSIARGASQSFITVTDAHSVGDGVV